MWSYIWNISYIELRMWNQVGYDPRSYERNLSNCVCRSLKNSGLQRGLNPWPRDTGATLQLSYEATDIGSWSFVGSKGPVSTASHRYREVTGPNPFEVPNFSGFYIRNCMNCVHNYECFWRLFICLNKLFRSLSTLNEIQLTWIATNVMSNVLTMRPRNFGLANIGENLSVHIQHKNLFVLKMATVSSRRGFSEAL